MNLRKLALCLLALPFVWACSSDNDSEEIAPEPTPAPKFFPLNITAEANPLVDPSEGSANTGKFRAPITFLDNLESFRLSYIYYDPDPPVDEEGTPNHYPNGTDWLCTKVGLGRWTCGEVGQYGWPDRAVATTSGGSNEIPVTWYAYTNGTINMNINDGQKDPYLYYSVEEASTLQHDLLVTKLTKTYNQYFSAGENLNFTKSENAAFKHACSALRFNIKKSTNVGTTPIVVSLVKLCHVKKSGNYYLDSDSWVFPSENTDYTDYTLFNAANGNPAITLNSTTYQVLYAGTLDDNNENDYLFMLPQTLTAWDVSKNDNSGSSYLLLKFKLNGGNETVTGKVPFAGTFEMGKIHEVNINIGKNSLYSENWGSKIINN